MRVVTDVLTTLCWVLKVKVLVAQLCPTLCHPQGDCSPLGSSVHVILQARILEWVAMPSSRGSSQPRDRTWVCCIAGRFLVVWTTRQGESATVSLFTWKSFLVSSLTVSYCLSLNFCSSWRPFWLLRVKRLVYQCTPGYTFRIKLHPLHWSVHNDFVCLCAYFCLLCPTGTEARLHFCSLSALHTTWPWECG